MADNTDKAKKMSDLMNEYLGEKDEIEMNMTRLSALFKATASIANGQYELYEYRHILVRKKNNYMNSVAILTKTNAGIKRKLIDNYKYGTVKSATSPGTSIIPKNADEREIYINDDMKSEILHLKLVDNQLEFIINHISTLDNMIYGVQYHIQLKDYIVPGL